MVASIAGDNRRWLVLNLGIVVLCASVIAAPHLLPWFPLPKSEDFDYTTVPSLMWIEQLRSGRLSAWSWLIGLGAPWPFPLGLGHSPLAPLFSLFRPLTATALIVWCHVVLMGVAVLWLCNHLTIDRRLHPVCVVSAMLAPHLEYLYASDAPTVFLGALWIVILFALVVSILDDARFRLLKAIALGLCAALLLKEGHAGVTAIYLPAVSMFLLMRVRLAFRQSPYFLIACVIAIVLSFDQLFQLYTEASLFPSDTPRAHDAPRGFWHTVWGLFVRPVALEPVASNMLVRTVSFGPLFALCVLFLSRQLYQREVLRPYLVTFWICTAALFIPQKLLPSAVSAIFPVRDFANLLGILLAGSGLTMVIANHQSSRQVRYIAKAQLALVILGAVPLIAGAAFLTKRGTFQTWQYNALVDRNAPTPYIRSLREAIGPGTELEARFIVTSFASRLMDIEMFVDQGAVNNVAIAHALAEVSFIAKGMSFDTIRRAQIKPYGAIVGDLLKDFVYVGGDDDWTRDDQALLTFLGIRAVVAEANEVPKAPALVKVATLAARDGMSFTIYRNTAILPTAFIAPADIIDTPRMNRPNCNNDALVCRDLRRVVAAAQPEGISVSATGDKMSITTPHLDRPATILVTAMHRPGWTAVDQNGKAIQVRNWSGIWRLDLPAGTTGVNVRYGGYKYPWVSRDAGRADQ